MRTDDSGPSLTHDGETFYFCTKRCMRSFESRPDEVAGDHPHVSDTIRGHEDH